MDNKLPTRERFWLEEVMNTISHGIGAVAAVAGFAVLLFYAAISTHEWAFLSALFYGISLISVFVSSTVYHGVSNPSLKNTLCIIDHACIFLLIAGTYTPILLITIGGDAGWLFFYLIWGLAISGVFIKIFFKEEFESVSLIAYIVMGWLAVFKVFDLYEAVAYPGFIMIILGGFAYMFGVIFFVMDKKWPFAHFIWHLFVIIGSLLHYMAILIYII